MVADAEIVRDRESRIRVSRPQTGYGVLQDRLEDFDRYLLAIERYLARPA